MKQNKEYKHKNQIFNNNNIHKMMNNKKVMNKIDCIINIIIIILT